MDLITRRVIQDMEGTDKYPNLELCRPRIRPVSGNDPPDLQPVKFTTLRYHRLDDMIESVGLDKDKLCTYCWDGRE